MSEVYHRFVIEVLYICSHDLCLLDQNRTCSYSFLDSPVLSFLLVGSRPRKRVRPVELVSFMFLAVGVYPLCLELSPSSYSKGPYCRMVVGIAVDSVSTDHSSLFGQEGC